MDDLTFRRRIYADPQDSDSDIKSACSADSKKAKFRAEMMGFDDKLKNALMIDVPENYADRVLLNKHLNSKNNKSKISTVRWAVAASIIFAVGISTSILYPLKNTTMLISHAISHMESELDHIPTNSNYTLEQVNAKLAEFGGTLVDNIAAIKFVSFCRFEGTRSLHIVMSDKGEDVTVFIVPKDSGLSSQSTVSQNRYVGTSLSNKFADMVVITAEKSSAEDWKKRISSKINWQKA
ncbi:DUF3379 domain-containing protein [Psychrosphaera haliotis]|uniref:DUF3379 family protein n=1 Tax=Psychrosphaera haliotis TaxID=555083 RepID=UPI00236F2A95|nr:DUF3379 domain-containing protein [Psychrosphaera haliotis]